MTDGLRGRCPFLLVLLLLGGCASWQPLSLRFQGEDERLERMRDAVLPVAEAALAVGQVETADRLYQRLLEIDPETVDGRMGMGRVALRRGDHASAARWHLDAAERADDPGAKRAALLAHGRAALGGGRLDDARSSFMKLADDGAAPSEDVAWGLNGVGLTLLLGGDAEGAAEHMARAVRLAPNNTHLRENLARAWMLRTPADADLPAPDAAPTGSAPPEAEAAPVAAAPEVKARPSASAPMPLAPATDKPVENAFAWPSPATAKPTPRPRRVVAPPAPQSAPRRIVVTPPDAPSGASLVVSTAAPPSDRPMRSAPIAMPKPRRAVVADAAPPPSPPQAGVDAANAQAVWPGKEDLGAFEVCDAGRPFVQVGAYLHAGPAAALAKRLLDATRLSADTRHDPDYIRVRLGPFGDPDAVSEAAQVLRGAGYGGVRRRTKPCAPPPAQPLPQNP